MKKCFLPVLIALTSVCLAQGVLGQTRQTGVKNFNFPRERPNNNDRAANANSVNNASETAEPWYKLSEDAKQKMAAEKFSEAKEAVKTAIRIAPMNEALWALYDEAAQGEYAELKRREKLSPVVTFDIQPLFHITRIDSYIELDTLYVVGSVLNTSGQQRQKIVLTAKLFDKNKKLLKQGTGELIIPDRGLLPNESSLFEIAFKRFPPGVKSVRAEVTSWQ